MGVVGRVFPALKENDQPDASSFVKHLANLIERSSANFHGITTFDQLSNRSNVRGIGPVEVRNRFGGMGVNIGQRDARMLRPIPDELGPNPRLALGAK